MMGKTKKGGRTKEKTVSTDLTVKMKPKVATPEIDRKKKRRSEVSESLSGKSEVLESLHESSSEKRKRRSSRITRSSVSEPDDSECRPTTSSSSRGKKKRHSQLKKSRSGKSEELQFIPVSSTDPPSDSDQSTVMEQVVEKRKVSSFMQTFMNTKLQRKSSKKNKKIEKDVKAPMKNSDDGGSLQLLSNSEAEVDSVEVDVKEALQCEKDDLDSDHVQHSNDVEIDDSSAFIQYDDISRDGDLEVYMNQCSSFLTINIPDTGQIMVLIESSEQFSLKGKYQLASMNGTGEIAGYKITPATGWLSVYSSELTCHLVVRAKFDEGNNQMDDVRTFMTNNGLEGQLHLLQEKMCVFLLKELMDPMVDSVMTIHPYQKLFIQPTVRHDQNLSTIGVTEVNANDRVLRIGDEFEQLGKHFRHAVKEAGKDKNAAAPSVVVVGGQNVGKSTVCRYLINSVLNCSDTVMFLDCDLGQTEVTPPGSVSLSAVTKPFLGPPFTHLQANQTTPSPNSSSDWSKPVRQYFCGHVTPSEDPAYYIGCLEELIKCYHDEYSRLPLVVNTMGWNNGLGLLLMLDTLKLVVPSFVAQIRSANQHRNFPSLSPQYVRQNKGWKPDLTAPPDLDYKRFVIDSAVSPSEVPKQFTPADYRDLALLAYLTGQSRPVTGQLRLPRTAPVDLFSTVPYRVPWSCVGIHVRHTAVPYQQIMYALNASVVGLCTVPDSALEEPDDPSYPKRIPVMPVVPCYMFGVVRGIDPDQRAFYIVTPEPPTRLSSVNALVLGAVKTPLQLLKRESGMGLLPYVDTPQMIRGMPRRRCHQRTRLQ